MGCLSWGLARPTADPVRTFPLAQLAASNRPPRRAVSVGWTGWTGKGNSERGRGSVLTITQRPRTLWVRRRHSEISRILLATVYRFALLLQNASIYPTRRLAHQNTATNAADWLPSAVPIQSAVHLTTRCQDQQPLCKCIFPVNPNVLQLGEVLEMEGPVLAAVERQRRCDLPVDRLLLDGRKCSANETVVPVIVLRDQEVSTYLIAQ